MFPLPGWYVWNRWNLEQEDTSHFLQFINTRKMVQFICCFQCPSAVVVENGKGRLFLLNVRREFCFLYKTIYYFLVASGNKDVV